jgi:hypothetical protein
MDLRTEYKLIQMASMTDLEDETHKTREPSTIKK